MQSMTGFGRAEKSLEQMDVIVEVRTLNGRYLDLKMHLPKGLLSNEPNLRKQVQKLLHRGRVDLSVNLVSKAADRHRLDREIVQNYLSLSQEVRSLGISGELDLNGFLQLPGVLTSSDSVDDAEGLTTELFEVLRCALEQVVEARKVEGANLKIQIDEHLDALEELVAGIRGRAEAVFQFHREKLRERIAQLGVEETLDESRLAQEVAYYARRSEISEEITRLQSHIERFRDTSHQEKSIGKSLDFLCQEMNREASTILAKSPLPDTSDLALKAKSEIEKIREQVQNVE